MTTQFYNIRQVSGGFYSVEWNGGGFVGSYEAAMQIVTRAVERMEQVDRRLLNYVSAASPEMAEAVLVNA